MTKFETNPNESGRYKVIHATRWSKGKKGLEKKTRLVVLEHYTLTGTEVRGYAVRLQTAPDMATYGGSSYQVKENAENAWLRKYLEHNEMYKTGNVSHLPGLAK